jgi:rhamnosyltransferase
MANTERDKDAEQESNIKLLPLSFNKELLIEDYAFTKRISAIIISYNPNEIIYKSVQQLSLIIGKIFIIDNNSCQKNKEILFQMAEKFNNIEIVLNGRNLGIACALNQGIKLSSESGFEWVVTLDQDSFFETNSLKQMFCLARYLSQNHRVGIIAPTYQIKFLKVNQSFYEAFFFNNVLVETQHGRYKNIFATMTSGNLIPIKVFEEVGNFDENFFIDYVDFEFCLRLNKFGYEIIQSFDTVLVHALGSSVERKLFFDLIRLQVSVHSPIRIYYKYRNRFITYKRYFFNFPVWVIIDFLSIPREILKINLVCSGRLNYLKSILKGMFDGIYS